MKALVGGNQNHSQEQQLILIGFRTFYVMGYTGDEKVAVPTATAYPYSHRYMIQIEL